jgi:hypothetical protein
MNNGCKRRLKGGQWWTFCGESDMGQTNPALCTHCGGDLLPVDDWIEHGDRLVRINAPMTSTNMSYERTPNTDAIINAGNTKPTNEHAVRKGRPACTGVLDYFPDAILAVAECSKAGNDQHNPGQPLHWAKEKSTDHADCIVRHLIDRGTIDSDGIRHAAKVAWRALALLQTEIEAERANND